MERLGIERASDDAPQVRAPRSDVEPPAAPAVERLHEVTQTDPSTTNGISPVASKWMVRNGFTAASLSSLFSLGLDEIDLVASAVPGATKKDRMRSVLLLKGIASYLSSGVARVSDEKTREACLHYDALDIPNFAKHIKGLAREVGGTKESGYSLSAAGLSGATELIKELISNGGEAGKPKAGGRKK
jgi:hypothetical protein